ncbi:hypothetical protein L7F22_028644 [Adiantum nelumboides]|nr:hypothetical protein [Adiantum nelumboides]
MQSFSLSISSRIPIVSAVIFLLAFYPDAKATPCGPKQACTNGSCCSQYGFCGNTTGFCGAGCLSLCQDQANTSSSRSTNGIGNTTISSLMTDDIFDQFFFNQHQTECPANGFYNRSSFLAAASTYPDFGTSGGIEFSKKELAAFFAYASQVTDGGCFVEATDQSSAGCSVSSEWKCASGKKYFGRGPLQIAWNENYGPMGVALGFDGINNPELVSTNPVLSFRASLWFWMTPQPPAMYSCHQAILSQGQGFKEVVIILNGGPLDPNSLQQRTEAYNTFYSILQFTSNVSTETHVPVSKNSTRGSVGSEVTSNKKSCVGSLCSTRQKLLGFMIPLLIGGAVLTLVAGRPNFKEDMPSEQAYFPFWAFVNVASPAQVLDQRIAHQSNLQQVQDLLLVAIWCIQEDPLLRPSMSRVVQYLEGSVEVKGWEEALSLLRYGLLLPPPPPIVQGLLLCICNSVFHTTLIDLESASLASDAHADLSLLVMLDIPAWFQLYSLSCKSIRAVVMHLCELSAVLKTLVEEDAHEQKELEDQSLNLMRKFMDSHGKKFKNNPLLRQRKRHMDEDELKLLDQGFSVINPKPQVSKKSFETYTDPFIPCRLLEVMVTHAHRVYNGAKIKSYYSPPTDNGNGDTNTVLNYESEAVILIDGRLVGSVDARFPKLFTHPSFPSSAAVSKDLLFVQGFLHLHLYVLLGEELDFGCVVVTTSSVGCLLRI